MMLRKRTRSHQKDQNMKSVSISESNSQSDILYQKHKPNSFFNVPGLFIGLNPKNSESDSVRSPTSPLDFRVFSNLGNPFRSPRSSSSMEGLQKSSMNTIDCQKVGLSIINSLDDDTEQSGKVLRSSDSRNIIFGPKMRIRSPNLETRIDSFDTPPNSLPKSYAKFPSTQIKPSNLQKGNSDVLSGLREALLEPEPFGKFRSCSLDLGRSGSNLIGLPNRNAKSISGDFFSENGKNPLESFGNISVPKSNSIPKSIGSGPSGCDIFGSLLASEIELSEDYTCVIRTYGPDPKTTHIFGDCILECHKNDPTITNFAKKEEEEEIEFPSAEEVGFPKVPPPYPSNGFLSFCYFCKKKLEGEDIYMYRGEKAFCSWNCRSEGILIEEAMEKTGNNSSNNCEELFETCMFITT